MNKSNVIPGPAISRAELQSIVGRAINWSRCSKPGLLTILYEKLALAADHLDAYMARAEIDK
jgi:hypothetical protein